MSTISMQNGVVTLPSAGLMASRLENFEIALRDQTIAERDQEMTDLIAVAADQIRDNRKLQHANTRLQAANQNQRDFMDELERAANQLADEREQLRAEVESLVVQSVKRDKQLKAAVEAKSLSVQAKNLSDAALKKLRAMEPEKQKARIDRLKRNSDIRKQAISDLRISNRQFSEKNRALNIEVSKLNAALDKAVVEINNGNIMEPIRVINPPRLGSWEVFGTNAVGTYCVMDVERQTNQNVTVTPAGVEIPNVRPVPKAVQAAVETLHNELLLNSALKIEQGE